MSFKPPRPPLPAEHPGYVLDSNGNKIKTTTLEPEGKTITTRYKMRLITRDVGQSLDTITSLRHFLCVMYDACVIQRNLYRKCDILHRDISDTNIMVAPDSSEFRKQCTNGYDQVKYINQVLETNSEARPEPACLVVDRDNGADLQAIQGGPEALEERTGRIYPRKGSRAHDFRQETLKFIARSVLRGQTLPFDSHRTDFTSMPKLEANVLVLRSRMGKTHYEDLTRAVDEGSHPVHEPNIAFTHRLFHDAESVFWVIAWILARSAQENYVIEGQWNKEFERFIFAMESHYPSNLADHRSNLDPSLEAWEQILHPDLACVASMLSQMHQYVRPEWAFRLELDAEHVHDALMRLLLTEIVRIDTTSNDVPVAIGIRSLPHTST